MYQDVTFAKNREDVLFISERFGVREPGRDDRDPGFVGMTAQPEFRDFDRVGEGKVALYFDDVFRVEFQLVQQQLANERRHPSVYLDPHDWGGPPFTKLLGDHSHEVLRFLLEPGDIRVPRHPERVHADDRHVSKERVDVPRDHLLDRDEAGRAIAVWNPQPTGTGPSVP